MLWSLRDILLLNRETCRDARNILLSERETCWDSAIFSHWRENEKTGGKIFSFVKEN
jgi:hypothetical protein